MANSNISNFSVARKKAKSAEKLRQSLADQTKANTVHKEGSRVERLKPLVLNEILEKFTNSDYFTRDHLLYFSSLRQFSMAYKIYLVREIVLHFISVGALTRLNKVDICVATPENQRKFRIAQKLNEVAYAGSYTTRSADELLSRPAVPREFSSNYLATWLVCLDKLASSTKQIYAKRICDDLLRRNILVRRTDSTYSLND